MSVNDAMSISDDIRESNYHATELAITKARWFVIAFMSLYLNLFGFPGLPTGLFNGLLAIAALYNLGIGLALSKARSVSVPLTFLSLYCDMTGVSFALYLTGGVRSPLLFVWYLTLFKTGLRFGYLRSLLIQAPMGLVYVHLLSRDAGISRLDFLNWLAFGLFSISAAALYGSLFSREEQNVVRRLAAVHQESVTDRLTGLRNYAYFLDELKREQARAERAGTHFALAIFDLDHFKKVNDTYGHEKGNELLRSVARILKASARTTDIVARYGGEEFVVLMPDSKGAEMEVAERIRKKVEEAEFWDIASGPLKITISAGICCYPREASSVTELLDKADKGLYTAKNTGRNRTCNCA